MGNTADILALGKRRK